MQEVLKQWVITWYKMPTKYIANFSTWFFMNGLECIVSREFPLCFKQRKVLHVGLLEMSGHALMLSP